MLINYDTQKINEVLQDFYLATGVRIDLFSNDFLPISSSHNEICEYCRYIQSNDLCKSSCVSFDTVLLKKAQFSKKAELMVCPFGLANIAAPIMYRNEIIGFLFFGQMKMENSFNKDSINECLKKEVLLHHHSSLPYFSEEKVKSILNLAEMLISQILIANFIKPEQDEILQRAVDYIEKNINKDLSIYQISKSINVSKSVLYNKFHSHFKCTIGDYINSRRIEFSVNLLCNSTLSIEEVSQKSGFSSASYYTKIFKQQMGITPLKYKKASKK